MLFIYLFLMVCLSSLGHLVIITFIFIFYELEIFIHKTPIELQREIKSLNLYHYY